MKRICIIGDSHAAALKTGWRDIAADYPGVELTFFAAMLQHMEAVRFTGDELIASTNALKKRWKLASGGLKTIDGSYDGYLICGLGLKYQAALQIHKILRAEDRQATSVGSNDIAAGMMEEGLRDALALRIADMLRQMTGVAILFVAQPLRAEEEDAAPVFSSGISENMRLLLTMFETACGQLAAKRKASFLPQQAKTRTEDMLATKARYALEPSRLAETKTGVDLTHMNAEYGAIVLREALGILANAPVGDSTR